MYWLLCSLYFLIRTLFGWCIFYRDLHVHQRVSQICCSRHGKPCVSTQGCFLCLGLFAAIIGPQLVKVTYEVGAQQYMGTYVAVMVVNLLGFIIFTFLDIPKIEKDTQQVVVEKSYFDFLKNPTILVAIICGSVSYALMNLVMTSTPLAVIGTGHSHHSAANIVSAHVLAMFIPSFFTGHLIAKFGAERVVSCGLAILTFSGVVGLMGIDLGHFYLALILLGSQTSRKG